MVILVYLSGGHFSLTYLMAHLALCNYDGPIGILQLAEGSFSIIEYRMGYRSLRLPVYLITLM